MSTVPLHCNICPKKPNFSDVSHLLTHIASKGHLSHYYKVKVRSSSEEESKKIIDTYDQWYADWDVEGLMSERMNLKEKRRSRPRSSATSRVGQGTSRTAPKRPRTTRTMVDPRLNPQQVKSETRFMPSHLPIGSAHLHHNYAPHMHLWPAPHSNTFNVKQQPQEDYEECPESSPLKTLPVWNNNDDPFADLDDVNEDNLTSECTKLKGVYWPGMDIFDSATPEMKRKRNQKKDTSVVEQLEMNSQEVEPTELIFTPLGSLKKQRKISGLVESSSPVKMDPTPRRPYHARQPFADVDCNRPRGNNHPARQLFPNAQYVVWRDDQTEMDLTYGNVAPKRKRGFEVFQDQEISFNNPASFAYLTSEFHYPQQADSSSLDLDSKPFTDTYTFDGKENVRPAAYNSYSTYYASEYPLQATQTMSAQEFADLFSNPLFNNTAKTSHGDFDDGRTITAPPSET